MATFFSDLLRSREPGPTYLDQVSGDYLRALCNHQANLMQLMQADLQLRASYANSYEKTSRLKSYFAYLEWLLSLRFLQVAVNKYLLGIGDNEFLPNATNDYKGLKWSQWSGKIAAYRLRRSVHALITLPLSIINAAVHFVFSPWDSIKSLFQTKAQRNKHTNRIVAKQVIELFNVNALNIESYNPTHPQLGLEHLTAEEKIELCNTPTIVANPQNYDQAFISLLGNIITGSKQPHRLLNALVSGMTAAQRQTVYAYEYQGHNIITDVMAKPANDHRFYYNSLLELIKTHHEQEDIEILNPYVLNLALKKGYGHFLYWILNNLTYPNHEISHNVNPPLAFDVFLVNFSKIKPLLNEYTFEDKLALFDIENTNWIEERGSSYFGGGKRPPTTLLETAIENKNNAAIKFLLKDTTKQQRLDIYNKKVKDPNHQDLNILSLAVAAGTTSLIELIFQDLSLEERRAIYVNGSPKYKSIANLILGLYVTNPNYQSQKNLLIKILNDLNPEERLALCTTQIDTHWCSIISAFKSGDQEIISALTNGITCEQRFQLCQNKINILTYAIGGMGELCKYLLSDFNLLQMQTIANLEDYSHKTPLMCDIDNNNGKIFLPFIKQMDAADRYDLCDKITYWGQYKNITTLNMAILKQQPEMLATLVDGFNDQQIASLLAAPFFMCLADTNTRIENVIDNLAVRDGFNIDIFKKYAERNNVDTEKLILDMFEKHPYPRFRDIHAFTSALQENWITGASISLEKRRAYLLGPNKPLARAFQYLKKLNRPDWRTADYDPILERANSWLADLTPAEQLAALTPAANDPHLEIIRQDNENGVICWAYQYGMNNIVTWYIAHGIALPDRFVNHLHRAAGAAPGIDYDQSIHNTPVHKTVADSLKAVPNANNLKEATYIKTAIDNWRKFVGKPDKNDNTNVEVVAKRALLRIIDSGLINEAERNSGIKVNQILAHLWYYWQSLETEADKTTAINTIYYILRDIQRGYNINDRQADHKICDGGTINQLTIALQVVCPKYVWVEFLSEKKLALRALNILPEIINTAYKNAANNNTGSADFVTKCKRVSDEIIPINLWPEIEAKLRVELAEAFFNRNPNLTPTPRVSVASEAERLAMIDNAINIIKGKPTYREYKRPIAKLNALIDAIPLIAAEQAQQNNLNAQINASTQTAADTKLQTSVTVSPIAYMRMQQKLDPKKIMGSMGLDAPREKPPANPAETAEPAFRNQYNLMTSISDKKLAARQAEIISPQEMRKQEEERHAELAEQALAEEKQAQSKIKNLERNIAEYKTFCAQGEQYADQLLAPFAAIAADKEQMESLQNFFKATQNTWLLSKLLEYPSGKEWLKNCHNIMPTLGATPTPAPVYNENLSEDQNEAVGEYLLNNSQLFYRALFQKITPDLEAQLVKLQQEAAANNSKKAKL